MLKRLPLSVIILALTLILPPSPPCAAAEEEQQSVAAKFYGQASELMAAGELDKAQECFDKAFATPSIENDDAFPLLLNEQATLLTWRGERRKAIDTKRSVIPLLKSFGDTELDVSVYADLGILYHRSNMTDSAIFFHEKADSAARVLGDPAWLASVTQNIGVMYYNLKRFTQAQAFLERSATYARKANDPYSLVCAHQLLSVVEIENGKVEDSGRNARTAWQYALQSGDKQLQLRCIPALYRYFEAINRADSVDHYMQLGDALYKELPKNSVIALGYVLSRARMHLKRGQYDQALQWYLIQRRSPMQTDRGTLLKEMATCYHGLGRFREEAACLDSVIIWSDSIARTGRDELVEEFNVKYNVMEKELENNSLRIRVLSRDRMILASLLALGLLIAIIIVFIRRSKRSRHQMAEMKRAHQLELSRSYIEGLEDERKFFAKELHDGVANDLLGIKMALCANNTEPHIEAMVDDTRNTVRSIARNLMPPEFDRLSLSQILADFTAKTSADSSAEITFADSTTHHVAPLSPEIARELYRIVQESIMNILRHTDATSIQVTLTNDPSGRHTLSISDNASTPAPESSTGPGIGLRTLADRINSINARVDRSFNPESTGNTLTITFNND